MKQKSLEEDSVTVSLDRSNFGQDDMANLIVDSFDTIYVSNGDDFVPITKEDIYFINFNTCKVNVKLNSNDENTEIYRPTHHDLDDLLLPQVGPNAHVNSTFEVNSSHEYNFSHNTSFPCGSGSGSVWGCLSYGLELI